MVDPYLVQQIPKPADRSATKPIYIVRAEDPTVESVFQYYQANSLVKNTFSAEIRGLTLSKAQAEKLGKNPNATVKATKEIHIEIPWHRIISIINITYKKRKESQ